MIVKTYVNLGMFDLGIAVYKRMRQLSIEHDGFTLPLLNQAILMNGNDVVFGKIIHSVGIQMGFGLNVYFCNTLIEVYVKGGCTSLAHRLFDEMSHRDLVSWTSMISGYVSDGNTAFAVDLFGKMRTELEPNSVTMITVLRGCSASGSAALGKQFHGYLLKDGFLNDCTVRNSLLQMYANKGSIEDVEKLYSECVRTDVVAFNILFYFYNSIEDVERVVNRFRDMQGVVEPSVETLTLVASSLSKSGTVQRGEQLHCFALKSGFCDHVFLTCLLSLYANCGNLGASSMLFTEIPCKSTVAWSSMMSGYVQNGYCVKAMRLFKQMQAARIEYGPDIVRTLIDISADVGALQMGKEVHARCIRNLSSNSLDFNSVLDTSILNMYIRCGNISSARHCFGRIVRKDVIAWTSMIEGLGTHGLGLESLTLFNEMVREGMEPNSVTFLSVLYACSHSGLTKEGCQLFHSMKWEFGVEPELHHYTCMVDLLGRSGKLKEALALILKMPVCSDSRIWGALLAASGVHMDRNMGDYAAKRLLELEPDNVGYHILSSNIQASDSHWNEVKAARELVSEIGSKKTPGWSCIEVERTIEGFVSGDRSHPQMEEVYEVLEFLHKEM